MRLLIAVIFIVLALPAGPAAAQSDAAANPYEGRAPVADQSSASRDGGLRNALAQVVERVSGPGSATATRPATAAHCNWSPASTATPSTASCAPPACRSGASARGRRRAPI
jgi:hypothetical protein